MPYIKKALIRKRKSKKRSTSSYTATAVGPKTLIRRLRYCTRITLNPGAGGAAQNHFFRANGMFDPDQSGTGHQPLGFDQYMLLYDHYKVISSSIQVKALNNVSESSTNQTIMSIQLDDDTSTNTNIENMIEQGLTTWRVLGAGSSFTPKTLKKNFNSNRYFSNQKDAVTLIGSASADPTEVALFNVSSAALNATADPGITSLLIVIDYIVSFSERKTLASS